MKRTINEVMTTDVVTVPTDAAVRDVASEMATKRVSCVVVVAGAKPIGIVTERDIVRIVASRPNLLVGLAVREIMSSPVRTLLPTALLGDALSKLKDRGFRHIPIVDDDGKLLGIVTQTEIVQALG